KVWPAQTRRASVGEQSRRGSRGEEAAGQGGQVRPHSFSLRLSPPTGLALVRRLLDELQLQGDVDLVADQNSSGLHRLIPGQPEVLAVQLGRGAGSALTGIA